MTHKNPVYGALYLAASMVLLSGIFFLLGAHFIATVQLAVYGGAVIVLFVMVLMLFDLKNLKDFRISWPKTFSIIFGTGLILGLCVLQTELQPANTKEFLFFTKEFAYMLFKDRILVFELFGLLLLLVAVGVIVLTRLDEE